MPVIEETKMSSGSLETAYAPFAASLLAGGFGPPPDGEWPAELIAAHVTRNNDLIAEVAEKVVAGDEPVAYDNLTGVDDAELASYADEVGGLPGLAREVERSAARLARAMQALDDRASAEIHVVIRDHGKIVHDGPMPIGEFIEGNASFHLAMHADQLRSLVVDAESGPPAEFDQYQLVLLERSAEAPQFDEETAERIQRQHLGHFSRMRAAGLLMVAGPVRGDEAIAGICFYRVDTPERARKLAEDDPAVRAGLYVPRVRTWFTAKDAIHWPADDPA
jgi:uncharacterized protein YciI